MIKKDSCIHDNSILFPEPVILLVEEIAGSGNEIDDNCVCQIDIKCI